jgi:hypothetical protein
MATKAQAVARLAQLGFELDAAVSGWTKAQGGTATIDASGRNQVDGECRGAFVFDYTAPASEFWAEVIATAEGLPKPTPCPEPEGTCEFHDFNEGD